MIFTDRFAIGAYRTVAAGAPDASVRYAISAAFAAKSWCSDDQICRKLSSGLIDRYLARSIAVPLLGSLVLAAMLLVLDKMLRLFQYVVDAGGPVSVVWRMLANLLPEYLVARDPDRPDARHPARIPQARLVVGARRASRHRHGLRPDAARALTLMRSRWRSSTSASSAISSPIPIIATRGCASTSNRARSAPRSRSANSTSSASG